MVGDRRQMVWCPIIVRILMCGTKRRGLRNRPMGPYLQCSIATITTVVPSPLMTAPNGTGILDVPASLACFHVFLFT